MQLSLSKQDTNILKGIALLMLLCHHLFYTRNGLYDDIMVYKDYGLVYMISMACKACVPLFVFLSGYGLTASVEKLEKIDWKNFFKRRLKKLYLNYWLIWLIFVPIGIFFFDRTFEEVYGNHLLIKLALDLTGLINCLGIHGYNPTWWFYSCIIVLYLLFPLICKAKDNKIICHLCFWSGILLIFIPTGPFTPVKFYLITFILGCYFRNGLITNILPLPISKFGKRYIEGNITRLEQFVLLFLIILYIPLRFKLPLYLLADTGFALLIIFLYKSLSLTPPISKSLSFLGIHSFNVFLFHTFIYYLYFQDLIYFTHNSFLCLISLLLICLIISIIIEKIKIKFSVKAIIPSKSLTSNE